MGSTGKRAARLLCVLAVLIGLFGMHGLATAQAGGCHGGAGMGGAATAAATSTPAHDAPAHVAIASAAQKMAGPMAGSSCLFTAPTGWPALALVVLAIIGVAAGCVLERWSPAIGAGRSPPDSGVSLLRRVSVSRT